MTKPTTTHRIDASTAWSLLFVIIILFFLYQVAPS